MTPFHDDAAIGRIADGLLARTLPKAEWSHAAHFAAALWLLRHRPALTEPEAIRRIIARYNEATGTPNTTSGGYHHTVTLASMQAAAAHLAGYPPRAPLHIALATLMRSRFGRPDWLLDHWRRETLFSPPARLAWVEPDRSPLPF